MSKKSKPSKTKKIIVAKPDFRRNNIQNGQVISMLGKLEKRTEKRMANFVKEIVKLKKSQTRLNEKLKQKKPSNKNNKKKPKT